MLVVNVDCGVSCANANTSVEAGPVNDGDGCGYSGDGVRRDNWSRSHHNAECSKYYTHAELLLGQHSVSLDAQDHTARRFKRFSDSVAEMSRTRPASSLRGAWTKPT